MKVITETDEVTENTDLVLNKWCTEFESLFNGSQLAKMEKSTFLTCHCHEIYREEAVGLKSSNYT